MILVRSSNRIEVHPIGVVQRQHPNEDVNDRDLVSKIVIRKEYVEGLDGIEDWSHLYVIFWMHEISDKKKTLTCPQVNRKCHLWEFSLLELQFVLILLV